MASVLWLPVIFAAASIYLYILARCLPSLNSEEEEENNATAAVHFPSNMEDLNALASLLNTYSKGHIGYVLLLFCSAYIFKQTFAIPGSVFLNLLSGALFGIPYGFPLVCVLTAIGATNCYLLSQMFGKRLVLKYFSKQIDQLRNKEFIYKCFRFKIIKVSDIDSFVRCHIVMRPANTIEGSRESLFLLILSLRLFPMAPNWLMNMAAPILNIPIHLFFPSVFIGLMPYNFLCVEAGCILAEIRSTSDILTMSTMLKMGAAAAATFIPSLLTKYFKREPVVTS